MSNGTIEASVLRVVIDIHPKGCVFRPGAAERIAAHLAAAGVTWDNLFDKASIARLKLAFRLEEIYCPHEPGRSQLLGMS